MAVQPRCSRSSLSSGGWTRPTPDPWGSLVDATGTTVVMSASLISSPLPGSRIAWGQKIPVSERTGIVAIAAVTGFRVANPHPPDVQVRGRPERAGRCRSAPMPEPRPARSHGLTHPASGPAPDPRATSDPVGRAPDQAMSCLHLRGAVHRGRDHASRHASSGVRVASGPPGAARRHRPGGAGLRPSPRTAPRQVRAGITRLRNRRHRLAARPLPCAHDRVSCPAPRRLRRPDTDPGSVHQRLFRTGCSRRQLAGQFQLVDECAVRVERSSGSLVDVDECLQQRLIEQFQQCDVEPLDEQLLG